MHIHELVRFSKERCFNGAVQTEWFYDTTLVSAECQQKLQRFEQSQKTWCDRFISPVISGVTHMNSVDCSNWLDKTKNLPSYLSLQALEKYKSTKEIVELQLHKSRVQGVFVMYDKLSEFEKAEFKRMIEK